MIKESIFNKNSEDPKEKSIKLKVKLLLIIGRMQ